MGGVTDPLFRGVGVALVTLFADDGSLDAAATAAHARRLVDDGASAVLVAGTTGEAAALAPPERVELLDAVRAEVADRVPVIAGTGAPSIRGAVSLTEQAREHGADAVLALSPPDAADPLPYYRAVAETAGDVPVFGYHYPAVSAPGIPVEVLAELPVAALKDSSGDAERLVAELDAWDRPVYVGSAVLVGLAGLVGARGAILGLANLEPERCARAFAGDADAQRELVVLHPAAGDRFPRGLKEVVAERHGTSPVARL